MIQLLYMHDSYLKEFEATVESVKDGKYAALDKTRVDFSLENFDRDKINEYAKLVNQIIEKDLPVLVYFMKRDDCPKDSRNGQACRSIAS